MSQKDIATIVKGYASHYGTTLDTEGLGIWVKALEHCSSAEVKAAFEAHRSDRTLTDFGRMVGETWPRSAKIESLIDMARRRPAQQLARGCRNPECSGGWVIAYWKPAGSGRVPYMERCKSCHPGQRVA